MSTWAGQEIGTEESLDYKGTDTTQTKKARHGYQQDQRLGLSHW